MGDAQRDDLEPGPGPGPEPEPEPKPEPMPGPGPELAPKKPALTQPAPPESASDLTPTDPLYPVPPPMDSASPKPGTREKVRLASLPSKEKLAMVVSNDMDSQEALPELLEKMPASHSGAVLVQATTQLSEAGDGTTISFALGSGGGDSGTGASAIAPTATQPGPPESASDLTPTDPLYPVPPPMDSASPKPGTREKVRLASLPSKEKLAMVVSNDTDSQEALPELLEKMPASHSGAVLVQATTQLSEAGDGTTISFALGSGGGDSGTGASAIAPTATQPGPPESASDLTPTDPLYPVPPPMDSASPKPGTREKVRLASLPSKEKLAMVVSNDTDSQEALPELLEKMPASHSGAVLVQATTQLSEAGDGTTISFALGSGGGDSGTGASAIAPTATQPGPPESATTDMGSRDAAI